MLPTEKHELEVAKSELRLIVQHARNRVRDVMAERLTAHYADVAAKSLAELERAFPNWTRSLGFTTSGKHCASLLKT